MLITLGLYSVLWGKTEEIKMASQEREQDPLTKHLIDRDTVNTRQQEDSVISDIP